MGTSTDAGYNFSVPKPERRRVRIGIKVDLLSMERASVRYRALYPALGLTRLGHRVLVFDHVPRKREIAKLDCIVIVKSWSLDDLKLAQLAQSVGVPLFVDLCDNIFVVSYGSGAEAARFRAIAKLSSGVTTTGPALAERIRTVLPHLPITIVPDPVETALDNAAVETLFREALAFARHRLRMLRLKRAVLAPLQYGADVIRYHLRPAAVEAGRGNFRPFCALGKRIGTRLARPTWLIGYVADVSRLLASGLEDAIQRRLGLRRAFGPSIHSDDSGGRDEPLRDRDRPAQPTDHQSAPAAQTIQVSTRAETAAIPPTQAKAVQTVIWFGNHGAPYGDFGIQNIHLAAPALTRVAQDIPLRLVVVSNNRKKYEELIRPLPFPTEYREWRQDRIFGDLAKADVCIVPNSRDSFSVCKSANRIVLSLACGTPVVATSIPASAPLAPYAIFDDWEFGLRTYLSDSDRARRDVAAGQEFVRATFALDVLAEQWETAIREAVEHRLPVVAAPPDRINLMFFLDLVQDLDLIEPVVRGATRDQRFNVRVCVTQWLASQSPRVINRLAELDLVPEIVKQREVRAGQAPSVDGVDCLLTASESTAAPHRVPYALVQRCNAQNVLTVTMQHGLENAGLTYEDRIYGPVEFGSKRILTWGRPEDLPSWVQAETRARCVGVGCPKPARVAPIPLARPEGKLVAIFENLHWERYDASYVKSFLADLSETVSSFPDVQFLVKPHHAGHWLSKNPEALSPQANLIIADPRTREWEPYTAGAIIEVADAIVTTPSTVALDAVRAGKPVAIAGYNLDLPIYEPLPIVKSANDWSAFIRDIVDSGRLSDRLDAFCARHIVPGDAVSRILDFIASELRQKLGQGATAAELGAHAQPSSPAPRTPVD